MSDPVFLALTFGFGGFVGGLLVRSVWEHFRSASCKAADERLAMWTTYINGPEPILHAAMAAADKPKPRKRAASKKPAAKKPVAKKASKPVRKTTKKGR